MVISIATTRAISIAVMVSFFVEELKIIMIEVNLLQPGISSTVKVIELHIICLFATKPYVSFQPV